MLSKEIQGFNGFDCLKIILTGLAFGTFLGAAGNAGAQSGDQTDTGSPLTYSEGFNFEALNVINNAVLIGRYLFDDSVTGAKLLNSAIDRLLDTPSQTSLDNARQAWILARQPLLQAEAFSFAIPDATRFWDDVLGRNKLPGYLDYVRIEGGTFQHDNSFIAALADKGLSEAQITAQYLAAVRQDIRGSQVKVTGYQAVEYLLWGQDLNGTEPGAGERPWTDYSLEQCEIGHCLQRRGLLKALGDLLVDDLSTMQARWDDGGDIANRLFVDDPHDSITSLNQGAVDFIRDNLLENQLYQITEAGDPTHEINDYSDQSHMTFYLNFIGLDSLLKSQYRRTRDIPQNSTREALPFLPVFQLYTQGDQANAFLAGLNASAKRLWVLGQRDETMDTLLDPDHPEGQQLLVETAVAFEQLAALLEALED